MKKWNVNPLGVIQKEFIHHFKAQEGPWISEFKRQIMRNQYKRLYFLPNLTHGVYSGGPA